METDEKVKISFNLSCSLKAKLTEQAEAEGKTITDVIVRLIEAYVCGEATPPKDGLLVEIAQKLNLLLAFETLDKEALKREVGRLAWTVKK